MAKLILNGATSGSVTLESPAVSGTTTLTLPTTSGTVLTSASSQVTGPAFSAYSAASYSISNATLTTVQNDTEIFDIGGCFNNTSSTVTLNGLSVPAYSFMPNVAGYYLITTTVTLANALGNIQIGFNGASNLVAIVPNNSAGIAPCLSAIIYFNGTTNSIKTQIYQTSGSALSTIASRSDLYSFTGALIRSA